jgi:hypothetical protein
MVKDDDSGVGQIRGLSFGPQKGGLKGVRGGLSKRNGRGEQ